VEWSGAEWSRGVQRRKERLPDSSMESFSLLHCDMHRLLVDVTKHFQVEEGHYLVAHLVRVACGRGREEEVG